jgi:hypothetical protein
MAKMIGGDDRVKNILQAFGVPNLGSLYEAKIIFRVNEIVRVECRYAEMVDDELVEYLKNFELHEVD